MNRRPLDCCVHFLLFTLSLSFLQTILPLKCACSKRPRDGLREPRLPERGLSLGRCRRRGARWARLIRCPKISATRRLRRSARANRSPAPMMAGASPCRSAWSPRSSTRRRTRRRRRFATQWRGRRCRLAKAPLPPPSPPRPPLPPSSSSSSSSCSRRRQPRRRRPRRRHGARLGASRSGRRRSACPQAPRPPRPPRSSSRLPRASSTARAACPRTSRRRCRDCSMRTRSSRRACPRCRRCCSRTRRSVRRSRATSPSPSRPTTLLTTRRWT